VIAVIAETPGGGPLDGVVVADFSRVLAGPLAAMMLGDLGAEVIKIERPGAGDDTRSWGPPFAEDGSATYYLAVNRNKRSATLDLADERQRSQARALAVSADVVVENFRAGTMERFGLDYESLRADNPGLVYCRVSAFGPAGGRDLTGYDFIVQAASGFMSITGDADGPPTKTGVAIVDVFTGLYATIGILAALAERKTSGEGQFIEVNLLSSALGALINQASAFVNAGAVPGRMGNLHPSITPYQPFATATEPIAIAATNERQFANLCEALEAPHLVADERFSSNTSRVEHREALAAQLESILRRQTCEQWVERLTALGIPCGPVNSMDAAFALAQDLGLDPVRWLPAGGGMQVPTVANPIAFSKTPTTYRLAPPELGADTKDVLERLESESE
jgi:crotonobetainyl-CoA:carnitine CoA-transferase CaiB-like acyl-CoA transferase